jgi:hypothetical protein
MISHRRGRTDKEGGQELRDWAQLADAERLISKKVLAFSLTPRDNPFMLKAEAATHD